MRKTRNKWKAKTESKNKNVKSTKKISKNNNKIIKIKKRATHLGNLADLIDSKVEPMQRAVADAAQHAARCGRVSEPGEKLRTKAGERNEEGCLRKEKKKKRKQEKNYC